MELSTSIFECHVTTKLQHPDELGMFKEIATMLGWKTSQIDGDPLLGDQVFFYFTTNHVSYDVIHRKMEVLAETLEGYTVPVLRKKIEQIIYDTKKGLIPAPKLSVARAA